MSSVRNSTFCNSDMFNLCRIFSAYILSLTSVSDEHLFTSSGQYVLPPESEELDQHCMGLVCLTVYVSRNTRMLVCQAKFIIHILFSPLYVIYGQTTLLLRQILSCITVCVADICDTRMLSFFLQLSPSFSLSPSHSFVPSSFLELRSLMTPVVVYSYANCESDPLRRDAFISKDSRIAVIVFTIATDLLDFGLGNVYV